MNVLLLVAISMVVVARGRAARRQHRVRGRLRGSSPSFGPIQSHRPGAPAGSRPSDLWARVGAPLRRVARRAPDGVRDAQVGRAVVAGSVVALVAGPVVGSATGAVLWAVPVARTRQRRRAQTGAVQDAAPELIDLFHLAVTAGCNTRLAIEAVVRHGDDRATTAFGRVLERADHGERLADALDELTTLGEPLRPLREALVASERHGVPVRPALERVADDARVSRRRRDEERVRRLPIKLIFPLVLCTLPALALVTVVPVVARSLPDLAP